MEESEYTYPNIVALRAYGIKRDYDLLYGGRQGLGHIRYGARSDAPVPRPLNPYLGLDPVIREDVPVFLCPRDQTSPEPGIGESHEQYFGVSYRANKFLIGFQFRMLDEDPCRDALQSLVSFYAANENNQKITQGSLSQPQNLILAGDYYWHEEWVLNAPGNPWHRTPHSYGALFTDGHADFRVIPEGIWTDGDFTILPFDEFRSQFAGCQGEFNEN